MSRFTRRHFIKAALAASGGVWVSTPLQAMTRPELPSEVAFRHGVASGDPLQDAVILWTRATPVKSGESGPVKVIWELARDSAFKEVLRRGNAETDLARDYTVKIDVRGLEPGSRYYYRFIGATEQSPVGRTRTLPEGGVEQIKLAVFSCSNYPAGYFNVYQLAAQSGDWDAVLHLGDYIYEYGANGYATEHSAEIGRALPEDNAGELLTLTDYRKRYALYRTDTGLQSLHASAPFIAVWDDHEISNDTWKGGAQNHNEGEGDFFARRAAAVQAYYEWLPIRPPAGERHPQIYRSFHFGGLVDLHMLDTRVIGRDRQIEFADYMDEKGRFDSESFAAALADPGRSLLGKTQFQWLADTLEKSTGRWQLLGQQVLMGKMHLPAEIMVNFASGKKSTAITPELIALKAASMKGKPLSESQRARLQQQLPYNLDAWDGYPAEREALYRRVRALGKNLVVAAGDTHNAWFSHLKDAEGTLVGLEFATASVSSPGMETYLGLDEQGAVELARGMPLLIDDLQYCNLHQRGYLALTFREDEVQAEWKFIDNIRSTEFAEAAGHRVVHRLA
ncbi:alkaline phosphatase D family protein [Microbulbifer thermotolerans]|uniref:Alkaline phosphatase D family protein n=1 Tax=Microbulbifer thermotolerans TaxID=252514 RepID=A0AB35HTB9_MICTH|nr:alkaline phosphatase D family protein [Microbulbifer thermotolerans]MCX2800171.1 alkaline phosphatase D family protein [Microbulbifer thermotolerans]MCX2840339.1 alkaline phosphatase D family protein [Microbulbifer thermotolerans]